MELRKQLGPFNKEHPYKSAEVKRDSDILTILQRSKTLNRPPKLDHQFIRPCKCLNPMRYGRVIGKFTYEYKGYVVDCFNGGFAGTVIPMSSLHMVTTMTKDDNALFILLVGNPDIFDMLAENEFYKCFRCIILTAEGTPEFLIKMEKALQLPVLALFNCDPHSLKTLAYYGCRLKNIKWLAIRPSDMVSHNMSVDDCTFLLTDSEITTANDLLMDEYVKNRPGWLLELNTMLRIKQKAEIESLACFETSYLTQVFLPMKLQLEDWI